MPGHRPDEQAIWLHAVTPEDQALREGHEPPHQASLTSAACDALQLGAVRDVLEVRPGEGELFQAGDPDVDVMLAATSGEDAPGSSNPPPDDSAIDEVGALYGVQAMATGPDGLVLGEERVAERDRHRWENDPRSKDP
jgi:hypothetical protein